MIPQKQNKQKLIVIVGPTSSGKSDLAVELALQFNGEVISADSRQVYKGLDIASGKITKSEMRGVTHHLLNIADPKTEVFTVSDFVNLAEHAIKDISSRAKVSIVAGGTMFYIDVLLGRADIPAVPPNKKLRKELEDQDTSLLFKELQQKDPERAEVIGNQNKRRIIRALEIIDVFGKVPKSEMFGSATKYNVLEIGINIEREELLESIHKRTTHRAISGMIEEAKNLHKNGLSYTKMQSLGLEYRNLAHYLQNMLTEDELLERIEINDRQYAKRQMKWWQRIKSIHWIKKEDKKEIKKLVQDFLS